MALEIVFNDVKGACYENAPLTLPDIRGPSTLALDHKPNMALEMMLC